MDLGKLKPKDTAFLHFRHPVNNELLYAEKGDMEAKKTEPIGIEMHSADSDLFRKVKADIAREIQDKTPRGGTVPPSLIDENVTAQLAGVTVKTVNVVLAGEEPGADKQKITAMYNDYRWIRDQAANFVYERSHFLANA